MKYECVESTLDITLFELHGDAPASTKTLRLWIDIGGMKSILPSFADQVAMIQTKAPRMGTHQLFEWLPTILPNLNAAQLIRQHPMNKDVQVGMVAYYVPFEKKKESWFARWWKKQQEKMGEWAARDQRAADAGFDWP